MLPKVKEHGYFNNLMYSFIFECICVLPTYILHEGVGFSGGRATDNCELLHGCSELNQDT